MGALRWWCFAAVLCVAEFARPADGVGICELPGCNCTGAGSSWKTVNCSFESGQNLELTSELIPTKVGELFLSGGEDLVISARTFTFLLGLAIIRIDGARNVVLKSFSFQNNTAPSFFIQIQNCDFLTVEPNAFKDMTSFIDAEINRISTVHIARKSFSRLLRAKFNDIKQLHLAEEAFYFEKQGKSGRHGPITILSFQNVVIPNIPRGVFFSALDSIEINDSEIHDIQAEAFMAQQISMVSLLNSTVHRMRSNAINERTLIFNFKIVKCNISVLESSAVVGAITDLTVQHCRIKDIQTGAVNVTVATVSITDNEVGHFRTRAFSLNGWNQVNVNHNIVKYLYANFLEVPPNPDIAEFTFTSNEIYNTEEGALSFLSSLNQVLRFDDNFFNRTCNCNLKGWIKDVFRSDTATYAMTTSFCLVTGFLAKCFELEVGLMNMRNFSDIVCNDGDKLVCEHYQGETKVIDTTSKMLFDEDGDKDSSSLILGLTLGALFIIAVSGTIVILLIRGGLWLKRKGYFRNMRYNHNEHSNDDENTIVTVDQSDDKLELPEELTPELLQALREQLDDPQTHQEAVEMIERLYDMFIVDESYTNNNRQEEEAHLYEELGNLQPQNAQTDNPKLDIPNGPINILKLMEEKINIPLIDEDVEEMPRLVGEYSEPSDAAVHLYSELKQNKDEGGDKKNDSMKSNASSSSKMAFRPLPDKPRGFSEAGPSSKM